MRPVEAGARRGLCTKSVRLALGHRSGCGGYTAACLFQARTRTMLDPKHLDDLATRLAGSLPKGLQALQADIQRNLRAGMEAGLARLDLVTREEFDVQTAVLARTRAKLEALEARVAEMERWDPDGSPAGRRTGRPAPDPAAGGPGVSLCVLHSRAREGMQAPAVTVEVHLAAGLPALSIVGLPEMAVKESKDRVRGALLNGHFQFPAGRVTINLAPADLPKEGGRFDLPIALGILGASGQIRTQGLQGCEFLGRTGPLRGPAAR